MLAAAINEKRQSGRNSLSLTAIVKAKENKDTFWKQTTELISLSRSGAGFYLERKCEIGSLVSLMIAMPKHLRNYDFEKELYRVWGLVQHCIPVAGSDDSAFHVGVAFAGKNPPQSYKENPFQSYRIAGITEDGTWKIVEAKTGFVVRRHPRFQAQIEVFLSAQDENRNLITDETAQTENISVSGAAVFSNLNVNVGDSVNFDCISHNFSALAIVRNCRTEEGELPKKIHLEFINADFPIEKINLPYEKDFFDDDELTNY
jgi:hypothetical protein